MNDDDDDFDVYPVPEPVVYDADWRAWDEANATLD